MTANSEFNKADETHFKRHFNLQKEQSNWKQYGKAVRRMNTLRLAAQNIPMTVAQRVAFNMAMNSIQAFIIPHED